MSILTPFYFGVMMADMIHQNILKLIGNTPLVKINKINPNPKVNIYAKLEGQNPTGSVKDRIALQMIEDLEREGKLKRGNVVIEPTSGNTGISIAFVCAVKGYKCKIVMPEHVSVERRQIIQSFGAELILCKKEDWRDAAIKFTKGLCAKDSNLVMPNQFESPSNVKAHYEGTGAEIIRDLPEVTHFVAGIGTGGTITGAGKRLKEYNSKIVVVGVEVQPDSSVQGLKSLKEGYIPPVIDFSVIDHKLEPPDARCFNSWKRLIKEEGIFCGISSGAAICAALRLAEKLDSGNIVVILPDRGDKYLSVF